MNKRIAVLALALSLTLAGCGARTTVTNTPTGVTSQQVSNWKSAVDNLQTAQNITHSAVQGAIGLNRQGVIKDSKGYGTALTAMGRAEQVEIEAAKFLKTVPNNWAQPTRTKIGNYTVQILSQLQSANDQGVLNVKDPTTGQAISDLLTNAMRIVVLVQSLAGGPNVN